MAGAVDFIWGPPTLKASNFAAHWPTYPILTVWKDLSPFQKYVKSSRGWAEFHRAHLVTVCKWMFMTVCLVNDLLKENSWPVIYLMKSIGTLKILIFSRSLRCKYLSQSQVSRCIHLFDKSVTKEIN